ncbi:methyl-accepting chemotaxis protein [Zoogloea sp.]|uniref:methyl-accepting chemotaxis protein n=1 Tax=Zoogloea sp. TaxID=49181 RepID=UPI00263917BA|nr:methyl-accepting chemotaxis protein [Zoogloea sp.]MDD3353565.1 methyl-accepting chemotaxis protein [Zoogloea sp.]
MLNLNRQSLVHQIAFTGTLVSLLIFAALIGFTTHFSERAALAKTEEELTNQVKGVVTMLELSHANSSSKASMGLTRVKDSLGKLQVGPDTQTMGTYQVPMVRSGDRIINGNTALLEALRKQTDSEPALLVRVGDDFVRAATLLKTKEGKSTEGTPIPGDSPEAGKLRAGKPYVGVVKRSGKYYISAIDPILDDSGKTIAALAARVSIQEDMERLFQAVAAIRSGQTGYAYIMTTPADPAKSEFIHHPSATGKVLSELNVPGMADIAAEQIRRKSGMMTYDWARGQGGQSTASKMVAFETSPSWGWIVTTGSFIDEFTVEARAMRNTLVSLCLAGATLLTLVLYWITRNRLGPIRELLEATRRMGDGDLSVRLPPTPSDSANELHQISRSLDGTIRHISELISDVIQTTQTVRTTAGAVRQGSDAVVDSTSAQNEAASGLAAAIEELSVSITHVSESAALAHQITQQAQEQANRGGHKVLEMVAGMNRIADEISRAGEAVNLLSERSARISNIGQIINDIADQTNLLALNAAIEAARAGESGRGFAVVADEVRKLAERTASSTREISATVAEVQGEAERLVTMIQGVTGQVEGGVRSATESGQMLETIRNESSRTTSAVNDIADATREQSAASQDVARGVERIAQMADQNNQVTRRSHEQTALLEQLAADLEAKVGHFRV